MKFTFAFQVRNEDKGFYYCQAVVEGEGAEGHREELQSNKLLVDDFFYSNLNQCSQLEPVTSILPATCATNQSDTQPPGNSITLYTPNYQPITVQAEIWDIASINFQPSVVSALALVEGCVYQYTGEPPSGLKCNPYSGGGQPTFECSVLVNTLVSAPAQPLQVVWYYEEEVAKCSGPLELIMHEFFPPFGKGEQHITQLTVSLMVVGLRPAAVFITHSVSRWVRLTQKQEQKIATSGRFSKYIVLVYSYN